MTNITSFSTAAPRACVNSAAVSPSPLYVGANAWRDRMPSTFGVSTNPARHNSNAQTTTVLATADNRRNGYVATKQATPPRGVPR